MSLRGKINNCNSLITCLRQGLQALGADSSYIQVTDTKKIEGSIDIDKCFQDQYPNENRWDYIIGYNGKAWMIEIHPAREGEISVMIRKCEWLRTWINNYCSEINSIKKEPFEWVASGKVGFLKTSNKAKALAKAGISYPSRKLVLK